MAVIHKFNPRGLRFPMTALILAVTVGVTLVQFVADGLGDHGGPVSARLALFLPSLWSGEWWRLFTVGLVHGDPWHVLMNGMSLWVVCSIYEVIAGSRRMLLVYLLSLIGGSAAVALLGQVFTPVVGASGAIFGVFGAVIAHVYSKFGSVKMMWEVPYTRQLLIVLALNIAVSFVPGISLLGHAGGLLTGFIAGYLTERQLSKRLAAGEKIGAWVFGIALMATAVYGTLPWHRGGYQLIRAGSEAGLDVDPRTSHWQDVASGKLVFPKTGLLGEITETKDGQESWSLDGSDSVLTVGDGASGLAVRAARAQAILAAAGSDPDTSQLLADQRAVLVKRLELMHNPLDAFIARAGEALRKMEDELRGLADAGKSEKSAAPDGKTGSGATPKSEAESPGS
jgi:membrane associated rhomboid family serine protease